MAVAVPKTRMRSVPSEMRASSLDDGVDAGADDGLIARGPAEHNLIGAFIAHERQIGRRGMGAALGAARNVDRDARWQRGGDPVGIRMGAGRSSARSPRMPAQVLMARRGSPRPR